MGVHKVLLAGLSGSGKTSLLKAISDMPIVEVEKRMIATSRTRALQYGRVYLEPSMLYLYATDIDQDDDSAEWLEYLREEMSWLLFIVDGTNAARDMLDSVVAPARDSWGRHRVGVAVSKLDHEGYRSDVLMSARDVADRTWQLYRDRALARSLVSDVRDVLEGTVP